MQDSIFLLLSCSKHLFHKNPPVTSVRLDAVDEFSAHTDSVCAPKPPPYTAFKSEECRNVRRAPLFNPWPLRAPLRSRPARTDHPFSKLRSAACAVCSGPTFPPFSVRPWQLTTSQPRFFLFYLGPFSPGLPLTFAFLCHIVCGLASSTEKLVGFFASPLPLSSLESPFPPPPVEKFFLCLRCDWNVHLLPRIPCPLFFSRSPFPSHPHHQTFFMPMFSQNSP